MDLTSLNVTTKAEQGAFLHLRHPVSGSLLWEGDGREDSDRVGLSLLGADSKVFRRAQQKKATDRLNAAQKNRNKQVQIDAEELDSDAIGLLALVTTGVQHLQVDERPVSCTPEDIATLFDQHPWIREQADEFIGDRGNFLGES